MYDTEKKHWHAEKFFDEENLGQADGSEWNMFFVHLTLLGCDGREKMLENEETSSAKVN